MGISIIPTQVFLPLDAVKLGRFVTSVQKPQNHYHDPHAKSHPQDSGSEHKNYIAVYHIGSDSRFSAMFTSLVSANLTKRTNTIIQVITPLLRVHRLNQSEDWFEKAIFPEDPEDSEARETRLWIEQAVDRGWDIYMVVGFHTTTDATLQQRSVARSNREGQMNIPVDQVLSATGLNTGSSINPRVAVQWARDDEEGSKYQVPGERICAVEYRKVSHKWLKRKDIGNLELSKTICWPSMEQTRGEEEDDIIKVEITDVQDLDGDWDKEIAGDETVFMPSL